MSELIITNGDSTAELLAAAGLRGRMLPWRDVLHEGPLLRAQSLAALSEVRASYLSQRFDQPFAEVSADFLTRDAIVMANQFERVTIWLEHDLYDQLQLLQILDFYAGAQRTSGVTLVQADDFLATQSPETVLRFAKDAMPVTSGMLGIAAELWASLTEPTPESVVRQLRAPTAGFQFLRRALARFLEDLPSTTGGLSRSERTMLAAIDQGFATPGDVFGRLIAGEDAPFMGDTSAFRLLEDLAFAREPLLGGIADAYPAGGTAEEVENYLQAPLQLTPFGKAVLGGNADAVAVNGIDRWWGGTHLNGNDTWRWDISARRLIPPGGARA